jgi:tetratricopeptide (TPR) repeat protein
MGVMVRLLHWSALSVLALGCTALADSRPCAGCHPKVWQTYRHTGMARSFYRPRPENTIEDYSESDSSKNSYYHPASETYFAMIQRAGRYFQRQYQIGFDGQKTNTSEKEVDFILGSGDHVRTYLHRTPDNRLEQLPLGWYAENGGHWAMNPGYDRPDHPGFRRSVTYDCMFCHNAYPDIPAANGAPRSPPVFSQLPEGIDCQRCHGGGEKHIALASVPGARLDDIRHSIVNPARLPPERQLEVCLQCHLQTTSSPLPGSIVRYERQPFSYQPGAPLGDFMLHFDHSPRNGYDSAYDDRFEITSSPYRLRQSKCFQKSAGALNCVTCHNPHDNPHGEEAARHYASVCRQCHGTLFDRLVSAGKHTESADCIGCHMPKRRAGDVVHAVMTDHYIQRRKPAGNLLAEIPERRLTGSNGYRGEVVLYYPPALPAPADELYLAIAQVAQGSNLEPGIGRLGTALEKYRPERAEYYLQLGDALSGAGQSAAALAWYEEALRHEPNSAAALERQALCLVSLKQFSRAEGIFKRILELTPDAAAIWVEFGGVALEQGRTTDALAAFERATQLDPDMVEAYNSGGAIWFETGDSARAERALRTAIRIQPNYAPAHNNLGNLLAGTGRFEEARMHFEAAIRLKENYLGARYNYALALTRMHRLDQAQAQLEAVLRSDSRSAEAHEFLGKILAAQGRLDRAQEEYRAALAIEPGFGQANLDLGTLLANAGDVIAALPYLRKAAASQDQSAREEAGKLLGKIR